MCHASSNYGQVFGLLTKRSIEDLKPLNDQRKILLPDNIPPSPPEDGSEAGKAKSNGDVKMADVEDTPDEPEEEIADTDEDAHGRRNLRRGGDRAAERQRKREEQETRSLFNLADARLQSNSCTPRGSNTVMCSPRHSTRPLAPRPFRSISSPAATPFPSRHARRQALTEEA